MSRLHGSTASVYLGSRDVSADLSSINLAAMADAADVTTFASNSAKEFDPGLFGWEAEIAAFYQGQAGGIGQQLETLLGAAGGIISVYTGNPPVAGAAGVLLSDGVLTKRSQPIAVADLIKLTGSFRPTNNAAKPGLSGRLLHPLAIQTTDGADFLVDRGTATLGGRANLHITAVVGAGSVIRIEDSPDNLVWSTLLTFTTSATPTAQTIEVAGVVNRYLRSWRTLNAATSVTYVCGFARY